MPREVFRREVEKELTGREEEPSELIYFKVYKSQIPVTEQAIDTAAPQFAYPKSPVCRPAWLCSARKKWSPA